MYVPFDEWLGIHPQDDTFLDREEWGLDATPAEKFPLLLHYHPLVIYRYQVLKQADIVPAMFLLGDEFSQEQKRRNFDYYDRLTTGDSSLSAGVQSIIAAETGNARQAQEYFHYALLMDLANVAGNASGGVHIAAAAGCGPRSSSGSAACATSTAAWPSTPPCRAAGTNSHSHVIAASPPAAPMPARGYTTW
jgi:alpha,alpha-trehalose phosphorylase